ncbi:MAG: hypothetical protein Q4G68_04510 [Planctomycetia bacterium]|nr:hypothetical protein [Planctomycetia bacterium]
MLSGRTRWTAFLVVSLFAATLSADEISIDSIPEITWTLNAGGNRSTSSQSVISPDHLASKFSAMIEREWLREDGLDSAAGQDFLTAAERHEKAADLLLSNLADSLDDKETSRFRATLVDLAGERASADPNDPVACETVYARIRGLKRRIALSNPLLKFDKILFCKRAPADYSHCVMQYYGWRARRGGGLFLLEEPGRSLLCRDITGGKLEQGSVLEPQLSWDAKKIVFSWVDMSSDKKYDMWKVHADDPDEGFYHVWTVGVDGSDLKQITAGSFDDITPNWLADGDIVFCSTRRKGHARCFDPAFGQRWQVYTLFRTSPQGDCIKQLSWHDTNEWFPVTSHNGTVIYSRWDYIDRDAVTHQNLWATRPDGTNPLAVWGNATPSPHCTFQARPIPNSQKYVFTASAHHSITGGSLAILDPSAGVDGLQALTRITPDVPFPESESLNINEYYDSPYPLSEEFFLVSYSPWPLVWEVDGANRVNALGIYLYDIYGNRELLYRDPEIGCSNPIPIIPQSPPPVLPSQLPAVNAPTWGEMTITDVYEGLGSSVARGSIKEVRVVQIFPKLTRDADKPPVGLAGEENARAILGTAPVEDDGSAHFRVPAETPLLLQLLDENGFAFQTMRSLTYLQRGEKVSCVGCHENRENSVYSSSEGTLRGEVSRPKASLRDPSQLVPGKWGNSPFSYVLTVQPIWDRHCISCHNGQRTEGGLNLTGSRKGDFTESYIALCGSSELFWGDDGQDPTRTAQAWIPRFGGRNTIQRTEPGGRYGALGSRLVKYLQKGHEDSVLSREEMQDIATWIDLNAVFYGTTDPEEQERQRNGEKIPMPKIQ